MANSTNPRTMGVNPYDLKNNHNITVQSFVFDTTTTTKMLVLASDTGFYWKILRINIFAIAGGTTFQISSNNIMCFETRIATDENIYRDFGYLPILSELSQDVDIVCSDLSMNIEGQIWAVKEDRV